MEPTAALPRPVLARFSSPHPPHEAVELWSGVSEGSGQFFVFVSLLVRGCKLGGQTWPAAIFGLV